MSKHIPGIDLKLHFQKRIKWLKNHVFFLSVYQFDELLYKYIKLTNINTWRAGNWHQIAQASSIGSIKINHSCR